MVTTYVTLNSSQPAYLHSLLSYHISARSLRSSNTNLLSVPRVHKTFGSHSFRVAAPSLQNLLLSSIHTCSSSLTFHSLLKTQCFDQAFSPLSGWDKVPLADTVHFKGLYSLNYLLTYFINTHTIIRTQTVLKPIFEINPGGQFPLDFHSSMIPVLSFFMGQTKTLHIPLTQSHQVFLIETTCDLTTKDKEWFIFKQREYRL